MTITAALLLLAAGTPTQADYRAWLARGNNRAEAGAFEAYLRQQRVAGVISTQQLLRTATSWRQCGSAFEVPPTNLWPRIVPTLRFVRDQVKPLIGPVEAVSGYRNPKLNACANGAPGSAHRGFWGFDLVPASNIGQRTLIARLCDLHRRKGRAANFGLGFYGGTRFHVDTWRYRRWGSDHRGASSPC